MTHQVMLPTAVLASPVAGSSNSGYSTSGPTLCLGETEDGTIVRALDIHLGDPYGIFGLGQSLLLPQFAE